jgi:hypothetical protein
MGLALFTCFGPVTLPLTLLCGAFTGLYLCLAALHRTLVSSPRLPDAAAPGAGSQPAYVRYFAGPALDDLGRVTTTTWKNCSGFAGDSFEWIKWRMIRDRDPRWLLPATLLLIALGLGTVAGAVVAALVLLVCAIVVNAAVAVAWAATGVLLVLDVGLLRLRGVTVTCGSCHHRIPDPVYVCSAYHCARWHTNLRPGRYGALWRVCACGSRLPAMAVLGRPRLRAVCPYCERPLADRSGGASEIVLPFVGPTASGKTRLMLAVVTAVEELAAAGRGTVEFASADTRQRVSELRPAVARGLSPPPTRTELPRAYSLAVAPEHGSRRLLHLFDMAGERLNRQEDTHELRFLGLARTFVFVVDPLSVEALWRELPIAERRRLASLRSRQPPQDVLAEASRRIEALGARRGRARAAVAVSKNDLIAHLAPLSGVATDSGAVEAWLVQRLGLGNLVRAFHHEFREVRFFFTAAVLNGERSSDRSVVELVRWLLQGEGLSLDGRAP